MPYNAPTLQNISVCIVISSKGIFFSVLSHAKKAPLIRYPRCARFYFLHYISSKLAFKRGKIVKLKFFFSFLKKNPSRVPLKSSAKKKKNGLFSEGLISSKLQNKMEEKREKNFFLHNYT